MTRAELRTKYARLAADLPVGAMLPAGAVYATFVSELEALDGDGAVPLRLDTDQAAAALGVSPKTIAHWCHAGRFPGARKTGGKGGKWTIPASEVTACVP